MTRRKTTRIERLSMTRRERLKGTRKHIALNIWHENGKHAHE